MKQKICEWCGEAFTTWSNIKWAYTWAKNSSSRLYFCSWNCLCTAKRANGHEDLTGSAPNKIKGNWKRTIE
ncbi:MAG: hypothetical protein IJL99_01250 [Firmicutes bacterium]|nr:hypothetical protein [Bacillota bacterium]